MAFGMEIEENKSNVVVLYKKRWIILIFYCLFGLVNLINSMQFTIIADVVVEYYGVSYDAVDWTTMIGSVTYLAFCLPASYVLEKYGLRTIMLIGTIGTCVGTWIKVASVHSDRFWLVLVGQGSIAIFQICLFPILPKLTAIWFGSNEIATALGIGCVAVQVSLALSYLIPPLVVVIDELYMIEKQLYIINISYALLSTILVPLVFMFFSDEPSTPPSIAQANSIKEKEDNPVTVIQSFKHILVNKSYMIYIFIHSVNFGAISPLQVLSNQIILSYYPDAATDVGVIGLLQTFLGIIGALGVSIILDKFKRFKETTLTVYACYGLSLVIYVATLSQGLVYVYISSILAGIFLWASNTLCIEVVVELTYPESENITNGLLVYVMQVFILILTFLYGFLLRSIDIIWANVFLVGLVLITDLLFFFMKFDLRRQAVQNSQVQPCN